MTLHHAEITSRLRAFLKRRTIPTAIKTGENAIEDQIKAFVRVIARYAPQDPAAMDKFWGDFESDLGQRNTTWSWPSEGEVGAAAKAASPVVRQVGGQQGDGIDPVAINLGRIQSGAPIGEDWLWGSNALRLIAAGADPAIMRNRRVSLANSMAALYGEDQTRSRLISLREKHEAAQRALDDWRSRPVADRMNPDIPSKRYDFGDLIA